jgi:hypothetical protein
LEELGRQFVVLLVGLLGVDRNGGIGERGDEVSEAFGTFVHGAAFFIAETAAEAATDASPKERIREKAAVE